MKFYLSHHQKATLLNNTQNLNSLLRLCMEGILGYNRRELKEC